MIPVTKGLIRIEVPALKPQRKYLLRALQAADVRDGFGLSLMDSKGCFWTQPINLEFRGPSLSSAVAILESSASVAAWPFISQGMRRSDHFCRYGNGATVIHLLLDETRSLSAIQPSTSLLCCDCKLFNTEGCCTCCAVLQSGT